MNKSLCVFYGNFYGKISEFFLSVKTAKTKPNSELPLLKFIYNFQDEV